MDLDTIKNLKNAYETVDFYFSFCQMGYFFDGLSKRINFSRIVKPIEIIDGPNKYQLNKESISKKLETIYTNHTDQSFFIYLTLLNSLRGITMGVIEAVGRNEDIKNMFLNDIFKTNKDKMESFDGLTRLIRNILSHNINDKIELKEADFMGLKRYWRDTLNKTEIHFYYDYSNPDSAIHNPNYNAVCDIKIDWASVNEGGVFGNLVSTFQCLMFMEFCYNALFTLKTMYIDT